MTDPNPIFTQLLAEHEDVSVPEFEVEQSSQDEPQN
jgi:hypothetical protein